MVWLKKIFGCRACQAWRECNTLVAEANSSIHVARNSHIRTLELEIEDLKDQRDKLQEALFRAARLTPSAPQESVVKGKASSGEQQFQGSRRNWNDVRSALEKQHRRISPEDKAKQDSWERINAQAEQEIPELAEALKQQVVSNKSDVEILAED